MFSKLKLVEVFILCGLAILMFASLQTCFGRGELETIVDGGIVVESQVIPTTVGSSKKTQVITTKGEYIVAGAFLVFHGERVSIEVYKHKKFICFKKECRLLIGKY